MIPDPRDYIVIDLETIILHGEGGEEDEFEES